MASDVPYWQRTRANRRAWIAEGLWLRKLSLCERLMANREGTRREFVPVHPIWHRMAIGVR